MYPLICTNGGNWGTGRLYDFQPKSQILLTSSGCFCCAWCLPHCQEKKCPASKSELGVWPVHLNLKCVHKSSEILKCGSWFSRSGMRPERPVFLTSSPDGVSTTGLGSREQKLLFVNRLYSQQVSFQTKRKCARSFLMLIHGQRGPELTPDSLFLLSKGEMATARGRHYCPKVKTFVWGVFRNFCPGIVRVVILIPNIIYFTWRTGQEW